MQHSKLTLNQNSLLSVPFLSLDPKNALLNDKDLLEEERQLEEEEERMSLTITDQNDVYPTSFFPSTEKSSYSSFSSAEKTVPANEAPFIPFLSADFASHTPVFTAPAGEQHSSFQNTNKMLSNPSHIPAGSSFQNMSTVSETQSISCGDHLSPSLSKTNVFNTGSSLKKKTLSIDENPNHLFKKKKGMKIELRTLGRRGEIPVVNTTLSGSRLITDTSSLMDYCLKWSKAIYPGRIIFRSIHNTGSLLMIIPGGRIYFLQFLYGKEKQNDYQKAFQCQVAPQPVFIFRSFPDFSFWLKQKGLDRA